MINDFGGIITDTEVIKLLVLGRDGEKKHRVEFTVKNTELDEHFTFSTGRGEDTPVFVNLLTNGGFEFAGTIFLTTRDGTPQKSNLFVWGKKLKTAFRGFSEKKKTKINLAGQHIGPLAAHLVNDKPLPEYIQVWHHGQCCKCNRILTDPTSIKRGIGPECLKRMI
jgi:hypothetical protein